MERMMQMSSNYDSGTVMELYRTQLMDETEIIHTNMWRLGRMRRGWLSDD